ncbi:MAG: Uma2 family endonuclease [Acidobacteriota bacterium]
MAICRTPVRWRLASDWVCEITSPSTAAFNRARKLRICAREQVAHAWLIDPFARMLEVLRLEARRWSVLAVHAGNEVVRAEPFVELEFALADLWIGD